MNTNLKVRSIFILLLLLLSIGIVNAQQKIKVKGKVMDSKKETIIGANVLIKGTTIGTITDIDGNFTLDANIGSVLTITYLGYVPLEVSIKDANPLTIVMEENAKVLEEVVVVGYGTQKKISSIGAQSGLKIVSDLKQPVSNLSTILSGRISGIVGVQRSGEPGREDASIWVRGIATMTGSSPLVLVDGVERSFTDLNPEDIETFSVLKDASATAVYGVRGANGVVIVTTKNGQIGKPRVSVEYNEGVTQFTQLPELADGITYMRVANEALTTRGDKPHFSEETIYRTMMGEDPYLYPNVDWHDQIYKDFGHNRRVSVNVNGGSDHVQYYVSLSYYQETGLFKANALETFDSQQKNIRYNFNSSLNMDITSTTKLKLNVKGNMNDRNYPWYSSQDMFSLVYNMPPTQMPVVYPDGKIPFISSGGGLMNPWAELTKKGYKSYNSSKIMSDLRLTQKLDFLTKGLSATAMFAYDTENKTYLGREGFYTAFWANERDANGELIYVQQGATAQTSLNYSRNTDALDRKYYLEASLNYSRIFDEKHNVTGLLLYNQSDRTNMNAGNLVASFPYRSLGIAGRATYGYKDLYMAEFNFGYNGAEQFHPDKRFGFFPSYGVGWVASNEKFFEPAKKYIQLLKFRGSYGKVGNSNININNSEIRFAYLDEMGNTGSYSFGKSRDNSYTGIDVSKYGVDVSWETSTKANLGVDLQLLDGSLSLTFDVFKEKRDNIFLNRASVPESIGLRANVVGNLGKTENKGFETSLDYSNRIGKVDLSIKGNFTFNKNKVIEDDSPIKPYPWMDSRGHNIGQRFGYICDGFYTQEEIDDPNVAKTAEKVMAGDLKYRDLNEDGVIDDYDKTAIGNNDIPKIVYGFGITGGWKGFTAGIFFQGAAECNIMISGSSFAPFVNSLSKGNVFSNIDDRWTEDNPRQDAFYPRLAMGNINQNYAASNHWLMNSSYLRLKTIDFGYTFPKEWTKKAGVSNVRLFVLANNVWTYSPFKLWDPELGDGTGTKYPNISTYSLGLSFQF